MSELLIDNRYTVRFSHLQHSSPNPSSPIVTSPLANTSTQGNNMDLRLPRARHNKRQALHPRAAPLLLAAGQHPQRPRRPDATSLPNPNPNILYGVSRLHINSQPRLRRHEHANMGHPLSGQSLLPLPLQNPILRLPPLSQGVVGRDDLHRRHLPAALPLLSLEMRRGCGLRVPNRLRVRSRGRSKRRDGALDGERRGARAGAARQLGGVDTGATASDDPPLADAAG